MSTAKSVTPGSNTSLPRSVPSARGAPPSERPQGPRPRGGSNSVTPPGHIWPGRARSASRRSWPTPASRVVTTMMHEQHLTIDDMPAFTRLRMTAFGQAVIDIANDPTFDEWTFSAKIRHALAQETNARAERRMMKLLKASRTPNLAACVEDIHYLPDRNLTRDVVARLAACRWIDHCSNLVVLGSSSVGKS